MKIRNINVHPISHRLPNDSGATTGVGRMVKRDAVLVEVETDEGITGWGEAHHGRSPGAIAKLIDTTLKPMVIGMDALDTTAAWLRLYKGHFATHGFGAGTAIAISGIDLALWDVRGKACGWPIYKLLGGGHRKHRGYAGGITLGFQPADTLVEEARGFVAKGYSALKLRLGDTPKRDIERVEAVRAALGDEVEIMVDVNAAYGLEQVRTLIPVLDACRVGWLEEPFPPHDRYAYDKAASIASTPIAAGENHYTRYEFAPLMEDGAVQVLQPDLSKTGGMTEGLRIAAMASARKQRINPHTSMTGLNMAASLHFLSGIENAGYFEVDATSLNPFRADLTGHHFQPDETGHIAPPTGPGIGVEVDVDFIKRHPLIEGPCYV